MPADPPPSLPAAVLWDMDGTLIDSERLWDVSLQATARELGGELSARARDSLVGVDIDTSIVVLLGDVGVAATPERIAWTYDRLVTLTEELFVAGDVEWRPGARAALRTVRGGRAADGAGDQQPAPDHRARARRHRPGVLRRLRLRRRGAGRQAGAGPLPARGRTARRPDRGLRGGGGLAERRAVGRAGRRGRAGGALRGAGARRAGPRAPRRPRGADRGGAGCGAGGRRAPAMPGWRERSCVERSAGGPYRSSGPGTGPGWAIRRTPRPGGLTPRTPTIG